MLSAAETFLNAAGMARKLAADYRAEASETTDDFRREVCLWEAEQADERAAWYSARASLFTPKLKRRKAA